MLFVQQETKPDMAQERVRVAVVNRNIKFRLLAYNIATSKSVHQRSSESNANLQIGLTIPLWIGHFVKWTFLAIRATLTASHGNCHGLSHVTVSSSDGNRL